MNEGEALLNSIMFISTILPVITMGLFSIKSPPEWLPEGKLLPHWSKINVASLIVSFIVSGLTYFFLYADFIVQYKTIASLSAGVVSFVLIQTIFTDGFQRLADRRILRFANVISLVVGLWFLISYESYFFILIYLLFFLFASIVVFLPGIGMSDGRAIQLIVLSVFPVIGIEGFQKGILLFIPIILLYGLIIAAKNKTLKGLFTKISVPMVPLMLAPFLTILLILPIL